MTEPQAVLAVTLPLPPKAQPRERCVCREVGKRCSACGRKTRVFPGTHPEARKGRSIRDWKRDVLVLLRRTWRSGRLNGPVRFSATFVISRPQSRPAVSKTTTRDRVKVPNPRYDGGDWIVDPEAWRSGERVPAPVKPDLDRYVNAIWDLLTEAGVWWDDAQVASFGNVSKWYAAKGERPSIRLRVEAM